MYVWYALVKISGSSGRKESFEPNFVTLSYDMTQHYTQQVDLLVDCFIRYTKAM
jgi:hypothetical protein